MEKIKHGSPLHIVLVVGTLLVSNLMTYMVSVYYVTDTFSSYQLTSEFAVNRQRGRGISVELRPELCRYQLERI